KKKIDDPKGVTTKTIERPVFADWSKDTFRLRTLTTAFEIDTDAGKAAPAKEKLTLLDATGDAVQVWPFPGNKSMLCLYTHPVDEARIDSSKTARFELQIPGEKKRKVILDGKKGEVRYEAEYFFSPSPDGKLVAVRCDEHRERGTTKSWILV